MVLTRGSLKLLSKQPSKIKFLDNETSTNDIEYHTAEEDKSVDNIENSSSNNLEDESESDSDEAPEEESLTSSKQRIINVQKEQLKIEQELKKQEKEKRRQKDLQYKKQQEDKRVKRFNDDDLPELLPEDIFESLEEEEVAVPQHASKHLTSKDFEDQERILRQKLKEKKLEQIRKQKKLSIKKGPVHVKVQSLNSKKMVPVSESKILNVKNKWLKRKSLNKK